MIKEGGGGGAGIGDINDSVHSSEGDKESFLKTKTFCQELYSIDGYLHHDF